MSYETSTRFGQRLCDALGIDYSNVLRLEIEVVPGRTEAAAIRITQALTTDEAAAVVNMIGDTELHIRHSRNVVTP